MWGFGAQPLDPKGTSQTSSRARVQAGACVNVGRCDHYFESVPELRWVSEQSGGRPVPTPVVEGKREGWGSVGGHGAP